MMTRFILCSSLTLALGAACLSQSSAPSLGDLARKTRAEKKSVMVFDDDNTTRSVPVAQTSSAANSSAAESSGSAKPAHDAEKKSEANQPAKADAAALDAKVAELQKKLDSLKKDQGTWSNSEKSYQDKLATETDEFRRNTYQEALDNDRNNADLYKKKIKETQADLAKAQDAAAAAKQAAQHQGETAPAEPK
jgi:hypothetical protein